MTKEEAKKVLIRVFFDAADGRPSQVYTWDIEKAIETLFPEPEEIQS